MRLLISGACGFVGSELCLALQEQLRDLQITGLDNLSRRGSWRSLEPLEQRGIRVLHGDIRQADDLEGLEPQGWLKDWLIDAPADPSMLAGVDGKASSPQLVEYNLLGTLQMLKACKRWDAGFVLLSTSWVYSMTAKSTRCATPPPPRPGRPAGAAVAGWRRSLQAAVGQREQWDKLDFFTATAQQLVSRVLGLQLGELQLGASALRPALGGA